jgi:hypothetical protein
MLLTVFVPSPENANQSPIGTIEALRLGPLTRKDVVNLLVNPFVENVSPVLEYAKNELNMNEKDIESIVEEVALRCLEIGSKVSHNLICIIFFYPLNIIYRGKHSPALWRSSAISRLSLPLPSVHVTKSSWKISPHRIMS